MHRSPQFVLSAIILLLLAFDPSPVRASDGEHASRLNLQKGNLALAGYDAVSYFQPPGPQKGEAAIESVYRDVHYRFSNAANKELFDAEPERYLPACGGWCAWAMLESDKVDVNPKTFRIHDGKLLLFYDGWLGDTRKKWEEKSNTVPEAELVETVAKNWQALLTK